MVVQCEEEKAKGRTGSCGQNSHWDSREGQKRKNQARRQRERHLRRRNRGISKDIKNAGTA